jgi:hypothetical protein
MMEPLDGNVLAGALSDVFAFEPTATWGRCEACSDVAVLGQAVVYGHPMGFVARCRNCDNVLVVVVEHDGHTSFGMRGLQWMRVDDAPARREEPIT